MFDYRDRRKVATVRPSQTTLYLSQIRQSCHKEFGTDVIVRLVIQNCPLRMYYEVVCLVNPFWVSDKYIKKWLFETIIDSTKNKFKENVELSHSVR